MKIIVPLFLVILTGIFSIVPLFNYGFFDFHDNTQVVRVYEMGIMMAEKVFPVRWVPDLGYGYGYPIFNFYGPFPYYVGGAFYNSGLNALDATKAMFAFGILASGVSMFFLARRFFGGTGAILSSVVYVFFPYHAVNIYVRGAVGEFFAYAFLPLLFLGIYQLLELKKIKYTIIHPALLIAFGFFLIATSHNLSIFMVFILLVPTLIVGTFFAKSKKIFLATGGLAILSGMLLSAFYILPAFLEMGYTNVSSQVGGGADFKDHFVCIGQYWNSAWGYGGSIEGCSDGLSFKLGKINVILLFISLVFFGYAIYKKKIRFIGTIMAISSVLLFVSFFLTISPSIIVWENIPFMDYIQYPWRFINFVALFLSFIVGYSVYFIREYSNSKLSYAFLILALFAVVFSNQKLFAPQNANGNDFNFYTNREYVLFTVSKISDEYMPKGFDKPDSYQELPEKAAEFIKGEGTLSINQEKQHQLLIAYNTSKNGTIHVNRAYYPSWKAYLDGDRVPLYPVENGMNIDVPGGSGKLELKFENTGIQMLGNIITVFAFLAIFTVIIFLSRKKN